ncbi:MAG TPA: class I SAM-dependent methyltransferase [Pyrinomonadaceae bacterium]|nr:class I SAM-dependent methyltransferase [Pyrinomonadaceae bacterium]
MNLIDKFSRRFPDPYRYLRFRTEALRLGWGEWRSNLSDESLPVPPPVLRFRVHGSVEVGSYLEVGQNCARDIKQMLNSVGKDFHAFTQILDFGCGSGRVMRFLRDGPESCHLSGTDIDKHAIRWCRRHLGFASWSSNSALPPTTYADQTFDFIYAISVFTHINEEMQFAWLRELKRITKPGGILILTVHGEFAADGFPADTKALIAEQGFFYTIQQTGRFKLDGLPDFYQATYHSRAYIEDRWSKFFKIIGYVERGLNGHQDAVILQNQ